MFATLRKYFSPFVNHDEELSFLQIFKPLYGVLSIIGLFPQAIEFPDGKQCNKVVIKSTRINLACTLLIVLVIHGFLVLHLLELSVDSKNSSMTEDGMTVVNYTVGLIASVLFCTVSYFSVIRDRSLYITILNAMDDCWDRLAKEDRKVLLGRLRVQVNCVVLGSVLVTTILLNIATYTGDYNIWKMILVGLTFVLPEMIQFVVIAFYFVMALMLVALLKNIEEQFKTILRARNNVQKYCDKADVGLDIAMAEVRDVYVKTMGIKRQINRAFQAPIMVALLVSFHELISMPHMIYHGLAFQSNFSSHDIFECSCWLFNQLVKMYALAHSGSFLRSQVNRIGRTIHKIPTSADQDMKIFLEVQHFSSLMAFQETQITVYGYFSLDATLMFNIVVSATMYLVILVQLDKHD
uniref:Gustatory receptor n=1 Tax=Hedya nubiferana TaxID=572853 RepID=A0A223HCW4_9NEOP